MTDGARTRLMHADDNVVVVVGVVTIDRVAVAVGQARHIGDKLARRPIASGEAVVRFGTVIGTATQDIQLGEWVHTHNLRSNYLAGLPGHDEMRT